MKRALLGVAKFELDVRLVSYGDPERGMPDLKKD